MNVLVVGGGGTIGSTVAYTIVVQHPAATVTLADPQTEVTDGHAIDLRHSQCHVAHAAGRPSFDTESAGTVTAIDPSAEPGLEPVDRADVIVVAASTARPPDSFQRGGRLSILEQNLEIAAEVGDWVGDAEPTPTIVAANPSDRITHRLWEESGWPRRCFIGYSLSETARIADELARRFDVPPGDVYCPILGEHGEHMVPVFSQTTVAGEPIDLAPAEREAILDYVRDVPYDVIAKRGGNESSRWVTSRGIAAIVSRLVGGGTDEPVCLSTPLAGEYGLEDVSVSVPVLLDSHGVAEIVDWELAPVEREGLERAADAVRDSLE
ncbi:lactate dehydrogenase [Natrinema sp. 1APR25-10V2]|uniref:malate dehydrogenase n=1 Tax=Natrinema sp. 1APR25-10V2 TaxID=2951081 RepID=UPI002875844F|nr:lactate dehydrogenase [Natrinema sp. 1APR25-10V2]MDS0477886.1 lactate dehydrogenase [Natrinema sp. 1APR25-10V2]